MTRHLDLDALADVLAGEAGGDADEHLRACSGCRDGLAELDDACARVAAALAALPPPPVPADLPARLDAALLSAREQDRPQHGGRRRGVLVAAAAVAVFGTGVGLGTVDLHPAAGPLAVGTAPLETAAGPQSATPGSALQQAPTGPPATSSSGTDYTGAPALAAALPRLLAAPTGPVPPPSTTRRPRGPDPLARLRDPAPLADCVSGLVDDPVAQVPLALDYARWAGRPALVVVLRTADPDRLDVAVVGAGCRAGAEDVLSFSSLPRPS